MHFRSQDSGYVPLIRARRIVDLSAELTTGGRRVRKRLPVQQPLVVLAHSDLDLEDAARRLRPLVQAHPAAARATAAHFARALRRHGGYATDRATRILSTAMGVSSLPPLSAEQRVQYERERLLGSKPVREAFAQLAVLVPELTELANQAHAACGSSPSTAQPCGA